MVIQIDQAWIQIERSKQLNVFPAGSIVARVAVSEITLELGVNKDAKSIEKIVHITMSIVRKIEN
jgi:hypothetical protein